jgi:hypothetical protein
MVSLTDFEKFALDLNTMPDMKNVDSRAKKKHSMSVHELQSEHFLHQTQNFQFGAVAPLGVGQGNHSGQSTAMKRLGRGQSSGQPMANLTGTKPSRRGKMEESDFTAVKSKVSKSQIRSRQ